MTTEWSGEGDRGAVVGGRAGQGGIDKNSLPLENGGELSFDLAMEKNKKFLVGFSRLTLEHLSATCPEK